jgi:hypothetical protein
MQASLQLLPIESLDWPNLERLCLRLGEREGNVEYAGIYGLGGQAQDGIDVLLRLANGDHVLIQARRIKKVTQDGLRDAVTAFLRGKWAKEASAFVFATSASARRTEIQDEIATQAQRLAERTIGFDVWDADRLSRKLKQHPDLVVDFFGVAVLRAFLPAEAAAESTEEIVRRLTPKLDAVAGRLDDLAGTVQVGADNANAVLLSGLSRIATDDADRITRSRGPGIGHDTAVRLSEALYVTRPVERVVLDKLAGAPHAVLLVGEPGTGKTSLLWRLQQRLGGADADAYMIRAPLLRLDDRPGSGPDRKTLIGAAETARMGGRRIAVLIDTADARLRDESERAGMLLLLDGLQQAGAVLVVSSRPREGAALRDAWRADVVEVGVYREELPDAVRRHVKRFYSAAPATDLDRASADVMAAVARGWPVQALLVHPLRLRMLFETYAPYQVLDEEIDTPALYDTFWERRVVQDLRPGEPTGATKPEDDLTRATRCVARVLLALGGAEQPSDGVRTALERSLVPSETLGRLRQRGLLGEDPDVVAFFHQTFFEYAAAREFLEAPDLRPADLSIRCAERPDDAFLAAVHEQMLVRASSHGGAVSLAAQNEIVSMLSDPHSGRQQSALYAYAAWRRPVPELDAAVDALLHEADRDLKAMFVRLSPTVPTRRIPAVLDRLAVAWNSGERANALVQLNRLAPRSPAAVLGFLRNIDATGGLLDQPEVAAKDAPLFAEIVLGAARAAHNADEPSLEQAAWASLTDWVTRALRARNVSGRAAAEVLRSLAAYEHLPGAGSAASRMHQAIGAVPKRRLADPLPGMRMGGGLIVRVGT